MLRTHPRNASPIHLPTSAPFIPPPRPAGTCPEDALRRALFLTNGNAAELRRFMPGLLGLGGDVDLLGLSRGYKAEAARRKKHDQGLVA